MSNTTPSTSSLPRAAATPALRQRADGLSLSATLFAGLCTLLAFGATGLVRSALVTLNAYATPWEIPLVATIAISLVLFWPALKAMSLSRKARRFLEAGDVVH